MNKRNPQQLGVHVGLRGKFKLVLNEGTDREKSTGWFSNLITDIGLDRLATGLICSQYGSIGTGTTTPTNGDTTLVAFVAQVNGVSGSSGSNAGSPTYVANAQAYWAYAQGAVVGNMAEVGVGWGASGTSLFSRALILDGGGSPTTLTVTSIDQLTVYYEVTLTPDLTDSAGSVTLDSIAYDTNGRIASANGWNNNFVAFLIGSAGSTWPRAQGGGGFAMNSYATQTLGAVSGTPSGTSSNGNSGAAAIGSYSAGQKYLDSTCIATPSQCNSSGGVGSIVFFFAGSQMSYQYSFAATSGGAVIPKDNTKTLTLVLRFSWDRL